MAKNFVLSDFKTLGVQIPKGRVKGCEGRTFIGLHEEVQSNNTTIWEGPQFGGSNLIPFPSGTYTLRLTGTDDQDKPGGTGAHKVKIIGLDNNWLELEEEVTLDGLNDVYTTKVFSRVNELKVTKAGSAGTAVGRVECYDNGNLINLITCDHNRSLTANYSIPVNKRGYLFQLNVSTTKGKECKISIYRRDNTETNPLFMIQNSFFTYENFKTVYSSMPLFLPPCSDLDVRGRNLGAGKIEISANAFVILEEL